MNKGGYTLIEALVYIAVLVIIFVVISSALVSIIGIYREFDARRDLQSSAIFSFERLTREIRDSDGVSTTGSVFDSSPGVLALSKGSDVLEFKLSGSELHIYVNGVDQGPLVSDSTVDSLIFKHSSNDNSELVRIEMTITSGSITKDFYTSVITRGSYEG